MLTQLRYIRLIDIADILIIAFVIYKLIMLIRGTRAVQLIKGLAVLLIVTYFSRRLGLVATYWLLDKFMTVGLIAIPIIFQPELRRALEQIGRGRLFARTTPILGEEDWEEIIAEVVRAVQVLSKGKDGALLVMERQTGLKDVLESGIKVDGIVSAEFLVNIFVPNTPLHDGAVIIRGDRVLAAGCFLPLSENPELSQELGTRHRAAIGITEQSDAISIVVSEETGTISIAQEGKMRRHLDEASLKEYLEDIYKREPLNLSNLLHWRAKDG
ncbi:MAG: TIGR00159 family protein [Firmicutes bacterium]|nr:TIGR00159 family protein [Bacillota bacterium]